MGEKSGPRTYTTLGAEAFRRNYGGIDWSRETDPVEKPVEAVTFETGDLVVVKGGSEALLGQEGVVVEVGDGILKVELDVGHRYFISEAFLEKRDISEPTPYKRNLTQEVEDMFGAVAKGMMIPRRFLVPEVEDTSDNVARPVGCQCTSEEGDSECPVHPTCVICGLPPEECSCTPNDKEYWGCS